MRVRKNTKPKKMAISKSAKRARIKRPTKKERIAKLVGGGMNIKLMLHNTRKFIVRSGDFPGLAEGIIAKERAKPPKRLFKEPMISR